MTYSVVFAVVLGALAGFVLGLGFFGALAWTARRLVVTSRPATLVMASLLARMALLAVGQEVGEPDTVVGLVALARLSPWALVGAVPGVITARLVVVRRFVAQPSATMGGTHEATGSTPMSGRGEPNDG